MKHVFYLSTAVLLLAGTSAHAAETQKYRYDAKGRLVNAMTVYQTIDIVFDANGNKIKETLSGTAGVTQVVQLAYDADQRLKCTALRMNPAIFATLPSSACTLGTVGTGSNDYGADRITENTYDANGRVTLVKTALGTVDQATEVATGYTANGRTAYVADAENNRTAYVYDGFDRLRQTQYPNAIKGANAANASDYEQLTYDANSNVTSRRLRDGTTINFSYDNLNRVTLKDTPNAVHFDYDNNYQYDLLGRLTYAATSPGHTNGFAYDALGRMTTQQMYNTTTYHGYDAAGRRTRMTWADGNYIQYDYDTTGNVTTIRENGATSGVGVLATYGYDNLGRRSSITRGNGTVTNYAFDPASRLQTLTQNLTGTAQDQTATLTYNPAGQIDSLSKSNDAYAWAGHYNVDRLYGSNGLNQLTSAGATSLGYDPRGNLTSSGSSTYTYTAENRLAVAPNVYLGYEPVGNQLIQLYVAGTGTDLRFGWDGDRINLEIGANTGWNILRRYVPGPGVDETVVWYEGAGLTDRRWLHTDERGSVTAVTNSAGSTIAINTYDEYGIPAASNIGRFQYTGQAWLPEIGMYYYKARMYSPTLGRFMQTDPIEYGDGMNWYNYVGGDPVNGTDPTGLEMVDTRTIVVTGSRLNPLTRRTTGSSSGSRSIIDTLRANRPGMKCDATCELNREMQAHFANQRNVSSDSETGDGTNQPVANNLSGRVEEDWTVEEIIVTATLPISRPLGWLGNFVKGIFGQTAERTALSGAQYVFQTSHYARRLGRVGIDVSQAELAAKNAILKTGQLRGSITINGQQLFYRAFDRGNGVISVGTIHIPYPK